MNRLLLKKKIRDIKIFYDFNYQTESYDIAVNLEELADLIEDLAKYPDMNRTLLKNKLRSIEFAYDFNHQTTSYDIHVNLEELTDLVEDIVKHPENFRTEPISLQKEPDSLVLPNPYISIALQEQYLKENFNKDDLTNYENE